MSQHNARHRAPTQLRPAARRRRSGLAITAAATLAAGLLSTPAIASTTISGGDAGTNPPVVRQNSVTITQNVGAQFYYRTASTAAAANAKVFTDETVGGVLAVNAAGRACVGNNPAAGGKNNSPRDTITVTAPGGATIATQASKARDISLGGAFAGGPPLANQPAPGNSNYLGDFPATASGQHGMSLTVDLTGRAPGVYTVTTESRSMVKTDTTAVQGTCTLGHPAADNITVVPGAQVETNTFEYRPWQNTFKDVLGAGKVFANTTPSEFQFTVGTQTSSIIGTGKAYYYALPPKSAYLLPSDPSGCATDPSTCLPANATACDPSSGCTPRLVIINKSDGAERLLGVFDLKTTAFIANVQLNGTKRTLTSLGTTDDAVLHSALARLAAVAQAKGIDLNALLATEVILRSGQSETTLSLLNALQINPIAPDGGIQIVSAGTVQAGVILDVYLKLSPSSCTSSSASSATAPLSYKPGSGVGYTVTKTALPSVPAVGPLGAIVGGPVYHILGNFPAGSLANTASAVIGIDTASNEPNGYPVWVDPFLSGVNAAAPRKMDFLGTATWSASDSSLGSLGCLTTDFMLGTGVAIYNNPTSIGFATLLAPGTHATKGTDKLNAKIDAAVQGVVDSASANPVVSSVLTQITGALPPLT